MKRSKMVRLVLMGAAVAPLAGCGDDQNQVEFSEDVTVYSSVEDCVAKGVFTEQFCRENYEKAKALNDKVAPHFSAQQSCEQQFGPGACQYRQSDSGSFWMPAIAGFMLGQALSNRRSEIIYQPVYRDYNASYGGSSSSGGWSGGYRTYNSRDAIRPSANGSARFNTDLLRDAAIAQKPAYARTQTISRGGFGSRAASSSSSFGG